MLAGLNRLPNPHTQRALAAQSLNRLMLLLGVWTLSALLSPGLLAAQQDAPASLRTTRVAPSSPHIAYSGRWNLQNPERPKCAWQGSSFIVNFRGTHLWAELDSGSQLEYVRIIIDNDHAQSTRIAVSPGVAKYDLTSVLPAGNHRVMLVKETYAGTNLTLLALEVEGPGLHSAPPGHSRKIEFYGDSNLAGNSLSHEQNQSAKLYIGCHLGLAGTLSRMFDADYHNISISGATISSLHNVFDRVDRWSPNPSWAFADFQADLVVVNLGANNVGSPVPQIKAHYNAFLDDLRAVHPSAHIMLANAWGWDFDEPANFIHQVIAQRGDPNMSSAIFPWVFEQWHGCETDHAGMAQALAPHISSTLGWSYAPPDVMSGFGVGGDVANGGFEGQAPFGGFGWRYKDDAGVTRVHDPASAHEGEFYAQLTNSDSVHQPNPAEPGDQVSVTWWARGLSAGDRMDVTIDFRNQEMYTSPLQSTTTTFVLSTGWQQFSMGASAPSSGPNPVYHTRLTFKARPSDTVALDGVVMTTL